MPLSKPRRIAERIRFPIRTRLCRFARRRTPDSPSGASRCRCGTRRAARTCSLCQAKNCAKGRTREALDLNRDLDNIKAQIIKHYQHLSDREAFVTAEMVRNAYQGFGSEYESINCHFLLHTNMKNISLSNFSSIPIPQFISAVDPNIIVISCNLHNSDTLTGCSLEVWIKNTTC